MDITVCMNDECKYYVEDNPFHCEMRDPESCLDALCEKDELRDTWDHPYNTEMYGEEE